MNRELDARIAEEVMGHINFYGGEYIGPHYSTRIQDAWLVVEKLAKRGGVNIHLHENNMVQVWVSSEIPAHAPTAPLAICLAALAVVERRGR